LELSLQRLEQAGQAIGSEKENPELASRLQTFLSLCRRAATLTGSIEARLPPPVPVQTA
jgi:hypothetical protein